MSLVVFTTGMVTWGQQGWTDGLGICTFVCSVQFQFMQFYTFLMGSYKYKNYCTDDCR